uniref:hypothetical protein n=1 Tax=Francisella sp. SYW-9 TaxID=2610888 RepID=UPI001CD075EE
GILRMIKYLTRILLLYDNAFAKPLVFSVLLVFSFNLTFAEDLGWDYVPSKIGARYTYTIKIKSGNTNSNSKLVKYIVNCKDNQKDCIQEVKLSNNKNNILYSSSELTPTNKGVNSIENTSNSSFKYSDGIYLPKKIVFDKPIKSESNIKTVKGNIIKYKEIDSYSKIKSIKLNSNIYKSCIIENVSSSSSNGIKTSSKTTYCKNIGLIKTNNTAYFKDGAKAESTTKLIKIDYPFSK